MKTVRIKSVLILLIFVAIICSAVSSFVTIKVVKYNEKGVIAAGNRETINLRYGDNMDQLSFRDENGEDCSLTIKNEIGCIFYLSASC